MSSVLPVPLDPAEPAFPGDGLASAARRRAMAVIIIGVSLATFDATILNLALPVMARDLAVSPAHMVWAVNAYQLAVLTLLLPFAALGSRFGYRRVYVTGAVMFGLSSAACMFSQSLAALVAGRAVQGISAAALMASNTALVRLTYPAAMLGRGIAVNSLTVAVSAAIGPTVAAAILQVASWPWLFAVNLPFCLAMGLLGSQALPRNPVRPGDSPSRLPALADVVLNALMFALVFFAADALRESRTPWLAPALCVAAFGVAVVHLRRQSRQKEPLFPVDLLRIPVFALSMCTSMGAFAAQMLAYVALPFLLLDVHGRSSLETGIIFTTWPVAIACVAPFVGRAIGRYPGSLMSATGLAVLSTGLVLVGCIDAQTSVLGIGWRMAVCGIGFGIFQSPNNHIIISSPPPERAGSASGMLSTARLSGHIIGSVVTAFIFSHFGAHDARGPTVAIFVAAAFAAFGSLFSLLRVRHAA